MAVVEGQARRGDLPDGVEHVVGAAGRFQHALGDLAGSPPSSASVAPNSSTARCRRCASRSMATIGDAPATRSLDDVQPHAAATDHRHGVAVSHPGDAVDDADTGRHGTSEQRRAPGHRLGHHHDGVR